MDVVEFYPIDVEQTSWQSSESSIAGIRTRVFVEEQNVPVELEMDGLDPDAVHWLAFAEGNKAVGTARMLTDGHVGRVAVLKEFRGKSIGNALMRKIHTYALREGLPRLYLHAQVSALPFYESLGYQQYGERFMDAGIPHVAMELNLEQYRHPVTQHLPPEPSEDEKIRQPLDGQDPFAECAVRLTRDTQQKIRIFSRQLKPAYLADQQLVDEIQALCMRHPYAQVRILLRSSEVVRGGSHPLLRLKDRLASFIQVRKLKSDMRCDHTDFLLGDEKRILYQQEENRPVGYCHAYAPLEGRELAVEFDQLWEYAEVDPQLRQLFI